MSWHGGMRVNMYVGRGPVWRSVVGGWSGEGVEERWGGVGGELCLGLSINLGRGKSGGFP